MKDEMKKKLLRGITVGEILLEDYLEPNEITQKDFANRVGIPASRINEIVKGRKRLTPQYASRSSSARVLSYGLTSRRNAISKL